MPTMINSNPPQDYTGANGHDATWIPNYGKRLVVQTVDDLANYEPERIWATYAVGQEVEDGFRDITMRQLANAVNFTAFWLESQIGKSDNFEVIAYLGLSDLRYAILFFAAVKCGYVFMVPSVRNADAGHLHVLEEAKCTKLFHSSRFTEVANRLQSNRSELQVFEMLSLEELLNANSEYYPYQKTWESSWRDPVIIAHSSGSTGFPKPITVTNGVFSVYDSLRFISKVPGRRNQDNSMFDFEGGGKFFNPYPPFHLAGLFAMTYVPLFYTSTVLLGPTGKPPTGKLLSDVMKAQETRAAWCPPTVIEQLLEIPGGFEQAAKLDFIMYTGGPLAPAAGDKLCQVTDICQLYGSTESGTQITLIPTRETWQYFEWHPHLSNEMESLGDGTYEMVIHKNLEQLWFRQIYHTFPELDTYRTNDLFVQHPEKPHLWKFHGRRDDVIVLGNGEKFNPVTMEGIVSGDPLVHGALIVGMKRTQAALLVEPRPGHGLSRKDFITQIWPTIQKANAAGPGHGRIYPSKIIIATDDRPFIRAGKGTVIRRHNIQQYEKEIEAVYSSNEEDVPFIGPVLEIPSTSGEIKSVIRGYIASYLPDIAEKITDDTDFFTVNLDSLQTTEFSGYLKSWVKSSPEAEKLLPSPITTRTIYENCSVNKLVSYFERCLNAANGTSLNGDSQSTKTDRISRIHAALGNFTIGLPQKYSIALTGSTGSLGTALLKTLIADPRVGHVYCLDRADNAAERHRATFDAHGTSELLLKNATRVHFLKVNFGEGSRFGLADEDYFHLLNHVDVVIHNAWAVNFNQTLSSFESVHLRGTRSLIDFCHSSPRKPHLSFVSSVSAVQNWSNQYGNIPVPESIVSNPLVSLEMGYGESKYVAERLVEVGARSGLKASILRVGQIAGPLARSSHGEWNKTEWFPILLKTSLSLGCIPNELGLIDWIPVDTLAHIISDLIQKPSAAEQLTVYNLVNPQKSEWKSLLPVVLDRWGLKAVAFADWIEALSNAGANFGEGTKLSLDSLPALKVKEFFVNMAADLKGSSNRAMSFVTTNGKEGSPAMARLGPIDAEAMETWLDQWNFEARA